MREFVGIILILSLILTGTALVFCSNQQKREVYIIRDHEIVEDKKVQQLLEQFAQEQENPSQREAFSGSVAPIEQQR